MPAASLQLTVVLPVADQPPQTVPAVPLSTMLTEMWGWSRRSFFLCCCRSADFPPHHPGKSQLVTDTSDTHRPLPRVSPGTHPPVKRGQSWSPVRAAACPTSPQQSVCCSAAKASAVNPRNSPSLRPPPTILSLSPSHRPLSLPPSVRIMVL